MNDAAIKSRIDRFHRNEQGFLLIVTMLILVVLTVIGLSALDTSTFEVQIANNDRWSKVAFNAADGAVYSTANLLEDTISATGDVTYGGLISYTGFNTMNPTLNNVAVPHNANDFFRRVIGALDTQDTMGIDPILPDAQIQYQGDSGQEMVEIYLVSREVVAQLGNDVGNPLDPYDNPVSGTVGKATLRYDFNVDGFAFNNSRAALAVRYDLPAVKK